MNQNIEINIEQLVLHGFSPADRLRIGLAVEQELGLLFNEKGVPPSLIQNINLPHVDAGSFKMSPNAKPAAIGNQIAGAVYSGFEAGKPSLE